MLTKDDFEKHAIHSGLKKAQGGIQKALASLKDQNLIAILNRVNIALDYLNSRLRRAQYELYSKPTLDRVASDLDQINNILSHYLNDQNTGHIHTLDSHVDGLLSNIPLLPEPLTNQDGSDLLQQASLYKEHTTSLVEDLLNSTDRLNKKIEQSENAVSSLNARIAENSKSLDTLKQQTLEITSEFQSQFSQSEDRRRNEFSEMLSKFDSKYEDWHGAFSEEWEKQKNDSAKRANAALEEINRLKTQASNLVGVIGNTGLTGDYKLRADKEGRAADIWRRVAIGFMIFTVAILGYSLLELTGKDFDWTNAAIRIVVGFLIGIPASYSAFESSKHRKEERRNRHIEQELAAIDPYLESFDQKKKAELKESLLKDVFGNMKDRDDGSSYALPQETIIKLLRDVLEKGVK
jgi:hypothetical protein